MARIARWGSQHEAQWHGARAQVIQILSILGGVLCGAVLATQVGVAALLVTGTVVILRHWLMSLVLRTTSPPLRISGFRAVCALR